VLESISVGRHTVAHENAGDDERIQQGHQLVERPPHDLGQHPKLEFVPDDRGVLGNLLGPAESIEPLYLRVPDAEAKQ
jgi:hypothetical protein